jgi:ribosomal protein S18 acetylase RimI-like enzyme
MIIRVLQESDAPLYQEIRLNGLKINPEAFGSTFEREVNFTTVIIAERIRPTAGKFVLGAFSDDKSLVGIVAFVRETGVRTVHKGNIYGMYTVPEIRCTGVGRSLLIELIGMARSMDGLEQLNLTVVSTNDAAKKLYTSMGFEIFGLERNALKYEGQHYDEELMVLKLQYLDRMNVPQKKFNTKRAGALVGTITECPNILNGFMK